MDVTKLQNRLRSLADARKREWWQRYLRYSAEFLGVGMADIRKAVKEWYANESKKVPKHKQLEALYLLFLGKYTEEKLAAVLLLELYLWDTLEVDAQLSFYEKIFDEKLVYDWNVDDWFCLKVLSKYITCNDTTAQRIASWSKSDYLWQARAGVVAFVKHVQKEELHPLMFEGCATLIAREERFAKTAVGWILHDLYKVVPQKVLEFVRGHLGSFDNESLRNALKYADTEIVHSCLREYKSLKQYNPDKNQGKKR